MITIQSRIRIRKNAIGAKSQLIDIYLKRAELLGVPEMVRLVIALPAVYILVDVLDNLCTPAG